MIRNHVGTIIAVIKQMSCIHPMMIYIYVLYAGVHILALPHRCISVKMMIFFINNTEQLSIVIILGSLESQYGKKHFLFKYGILNQQPVST
jgi:hypothetical protein